MAGKYKQVATVVTRNNDPEGLMQELITPGDDVDDGTKGTKICSFMKRFKVSSYITMAFVILAITGVVVVVATGAYPAAHQQMADAHVVLTDREETKAVPSGYTRFAGSCVNGANIILYRGKSVAECAQYCDANPACKAFEYGVGGGSTYRMSDCQPQTSADSSGCDGSRYGLDLYAKAPTTEAPTTDAPTTMAPTTKATQVAYLGCFRDDSSRDMRHGPRAYGFSVTSCATSCCSTYKYFALQHGGWCVCDNTYSTPQASYPKIADSECGSNKLGGAWANSVFTCQAPTTEPPTTEAAYKLIASSSSCYNSQNQHPPYEGLSESDNSPGNCLAACKSRATMLGFATRATGFDTRSGCLCYYGYYDTRSGLTRDQVTKGKLDGIAGDCYAVQAR